MSSYAAFSYALSSSSDEADVHDDTRRPSAVAEMTRDEAIQHFFDQATEHDSAGLTAVAAAGERSFFLLGAGGGLHAAGFGGAGAFDCVGFGAAFAAPRGRSSISTHSSPRATCTLRPLSPLALLLLDLRMFDAGGSCGSDFCGRCFCKPEPLPFFGIVFTARGRWSLQPAS